ncbi:MAG: DUF2141 domain-containing protein [Cyanobacteria bacterium P01_A01_bin.68]
MKLQFIVAILAVTTLGNIALFSQANAAFKGNMRVRIDGLKNQKGQVCLNIFSTSKGFPSNNKQAIKTRCVKAAKNSITVDFPDLEAGNYAVAVIHDANGDNTLNRNALSIPTEGFGFSNNPKILTSPPKFGDSAVFVAGSNTNIQVKLQYFLGR